MKSIVDLDSHLEKQQQRKMENSHTAALLARKGKDPLADQFPVPSARVHSLAGMRFGRLSVRHFTGLNRWRKATWCCECDCGNFVQVEGGALLGHKHGVTKSCGCLRADPEIRRAARDKVPPKKRAEICKKMRESVKNRKPAYSLSLDRAAEIMGLTPDRLRTLCHSGVLGSTLRSGRYWVSSRDVSEYMAAQERDRNANCKTRQKVLRRAMIASRTRPRGTWTSGPAT